MNNNSLLGLPSEEEMEDDILQTNWGNTEPA
jgi:hypothetical protein